MAEEEREAKIEGEKSEAVVDKGKKINRRKN